MTSDKGTKRTSESSALLPILQILACACEFVTFRGLTESMHEASCFGRARAGRKSGKRDAGLMARATRCGTRPRQIGQLHETYFKCLWSVWRPCRKKPCSQKKSTEKYFMHLFAYISAHFLLHASKHFQMFSACCCHTFNASITSFVFELFWLRAFLRFVSQMIKETLIQPLSSRQFSRLLLLEGHLFRFFFLV